jgi:ComF family protein
MLGVCSTDGCENGEALKSQPLKPGILIRVTKAIKNALFPAQCLVCGSFFYHPSCPNDDSHAKGLQIETIAGFSTLMAPFLCKSCSEGFCAVESPMCSKCGIMFKSRQGEDHVCGHCLASPKRFEMARSAGVYDRALMAAIHCLKYNGKIQLAKALGVLLLAGFIHFWENRRIDLVVPVPLHIRRMRMRGFNQAFLLIRNWTSIAERLDIKHLQIRVERNALIRKKWTEPQTGLSRKQRLTNVRNAYGINDSGNIVGKRILLVDDVYTTGATVNECAKVLLDGGAKRVDVLTLAQAVY